MLVEGTVRAEELAAGAAARFCSPWLPHYGRLVELRRLSARCWARWRRCELRCAGVVESAGDATGVGRRTEARSLARYFTCWGDGPAFDGCWDGVGAAVFRWRRVMGEKSIPSCSFLDVHERYGLTL